MRSQRAEADFLLSQGADPAARAGLEALLTVAEVAKLLALSERTVKRLVARGFPCLRVGRSLRFEPQAVARWLSARREGA